MTSWADTARVSNEWGAYELAIAAYHLCDSDSDASDLLRFLHHVDGCDVAMTVIVLYDPFFRLSIFIKSHQAFKVS